MLRDENFQRSLKNYSLFYISMRFASLTKPTSQKPFVVHVILILRHDYQKPLLLVILCRLSQGTISQTDCPHTVCSVFMIRQV